MIGIPDSYPIRLAGIIILIASVAVPMPMFLRADAY